LATGKLTDDPVLLEEFFAAAKGGDKKDGGQGIPEEEGGTEEALEGAFCPWIYAPSGEHGVFRNASPFALLCIGAVLEKDGTLRSTGLPWIPRTLLQPLNDDGVTVGSVEDSDAALTALAAQPSKEDSWQETARVCREYLEAVTGSSAPPDLPGYTRVPGGAFVAGAPIGVSRHVQALYDALLDKKPSAPLLERLVQGQAPSSPLLTADEEIRVSRKHWGTMSGKFPLSSSQRRAMHHFLGMHDGEVLAVNGPPGTGKTTMLQSIVAQLWVDAAYNRRECPLVVASSTNNQAVTNIIDSFGKVADASGDALYTRWVPDVKSFGLQMARKERWKDAFHAHDDRSLQDGFFATIENPAWRERATTFFLEKCQGRYGVVTDLNGAVEALSAELKDVVERIDGVIGTASALAGEDHKKDLFSLYEEALQRRQQEQTVLKTNLAILRLRKSAVKGWAVEWERFVRDESVFLAIFSFLPPIRKKREAATRAFLLARRTVAEELHRDGITGIFRRELDAEKEIHRDRITEAFRREREELAAAEEKVCSAREEHAAETTRLKEQRALLEAHLKFFGIDAGGGALSLRGLLEEIDQRGRSRAFYLATHYWEAQYLLELGEKLCEEAKNASSGSTAKYDSKAPAKRIRMYRRFAKLTPCQVITFYMLPHYYCGYLGHPIHLFGEIDLLIVDEAGQVSPEIGVPSFSLAKRALVVGDTFQIEPVWSVMRRTDEANAVKDGVVLSPEEYDGLSRKNLSPEAYEKALVEKGCLAGSYEEGQCRGFLAASGNLMRLAQRACRHTDYPDLAPGLMLTEHRRCVPEIIAYCNDLVYRGKLEPRREESPEERRRRPDFLPPLGEIDVKGSEERAGGSRRNAKEAEATAQWVKEHAEGMKIRYENKPLEEILGIITPFAAQKKCILDALANSLGPEHGITVGTVHALQGAERSVVLFSPTYDQNHTGDMFFDRGSNMMNVAVSRAKDSFLVIGATALFQEENLSPSGLLARHIRAIPAPQDHGSRNEKP